RCPQGGFVVPLPLGTVVQPPAVNCTDPGKSQKCGYDASGSNGGIASATSSGSASASAPSGCGSGVTLTSSPRRESVLASGPVSGCVASGTIGASAEEQAKKPRTTKGRARCTRGLSHDASSPRSPAPGAGPT